MKKIISVFTAAAFTLMLGSCADKNALQTSAVPVRWLERPSVILDAGHGGADGGGVSVNGVPEKGINLNIAATTADLLMLMGYKVTLTRTEDVSIHDSGTEGLKAQKLSDMENRLKLFNTPDSVCVSIHQNQFTDPKYSGAQMFYSATNKKSKALAEAVQSKFREY